MYNNVIVIDDSEIDRFISRSVIKRNNFALSCIAFATVEDGLAYLRTLINLSEPFPEIIFLDVNMPEMDGFDFLDNYLKLPPDIQTTSNIFMISATNSESDYARIKTYSIVRKLFSKPLTPSILNEVKHYLQN